MWKQIYIYKRKEIMSLYDRTLKVHKKLFSLIYIVDQNNYRRNSEFIANIFF